MIVKNAIFAGLIMMTFISAASVGNDEFDGIREKWRKIIINMPDGNNIQNRQKIEKITTQLEKNSEKILGKLNTDPNRQYIFDDLKDMKNGAQILSAFENVKTLVKAYFTDGTKYYKSDDLKKNIIESLIWLNENVYNDSLQELGNWWQWEIGIPKSINETGIIMYGEIPDDLLDNLMKASKYFQPYATHSGASPAAKYSTSPNKRISKGGNRMDTAIISFGRGILTKDRTETMNGIDAVGDIGEIVTKGDGFYEDGSFIQHENVAYSGTYASVLFNGLGTLLYVAKDTSFLPKDPRLETLYGSIIKGYTYLLINGGINDSVSGRSLSRDNSNDLERGRSLIGAFGMVSEGAVSPHKEEIQKLVKRAIAENNSYSVTEKTGNLVVEKVLKDIVNDNNINIEEIHGTKIFSSMDRAVQVSRRKGKFVISMHSSRIANFETMNGENLKGWYTGDGMTYIYGTDSSAFTDYWQTADKLHMPGTTESISKRADGSGERRVPSAVSPKAWAGGATDGNTAMTGMDFISWNNKTEAKKSWFMLGEEIIAVGSGITSSDDEIHTTLDNRIIHNTNDKKVTIDRQNVTSIKKIQAKKGTYINFTDQKTGENIGYKILEPSILTVDIKNEKGSWKEIGGKSADIHEKAYFKAYIEHGKNPKNSKYAYIILPMFTEEEVEKYNENTVEIIRLDDEVHAIEDKKRKITGMNFWKNKEVKVNGIKVFSPVSLIKTEKGDGITLAVSDPTQLSKYETELEIDGEYSLLSSSQAVKINVGNGKTKLKINLVNRGQSVIINLKRI
ncbi:MAG: polysaccharide lyase 8 family protein [Leptotrichiaceae bacterium]|nr:polysaccharide lyase 8 family protein [Leptotrichiaceae bacterium]